MTDEENAIIQATLEHGWVQTTEYRYVRINLPNRVQIRRVLLSDLERFPAPWETIYKKQAAN